MPETPQACDYLATIDGRTYTVTRLVADIAENYYTLMALTSGWRTSIKPLAV